MLSMLNRVLFPIFFNDVETTKKLQKKYSRVHNCEHHTCFYFFSISLVPVRRTCCFDPRHKKNFNSLLHFETLLWIIKKYFSLHNPNFLQIPWNFKPLFEAENLPSFVAVCGQKKLLNIEIRSVTNLIDEINTQLRNQFSRKDQTILKTSETICTVG